MRHRFEVLDIFRGIFASLVFLYHLSSTTNTPFIYNDFIRNADVFVDFFFVLSGFVIAYSYEDIRDITQARNFLKRRFMRIYPLHLFMLLLFLLMEATKIWTHTLNPSNNLATFLASLFLVNSFPVTSVRDVSWNTVSWSISAEMTAYLLFACVLPLIYAGNLRKYRGWIYAGIILIAAIGLFLLTGTLSITYTYDYGFLRGIIGFFSGLIAFNAFLVTRERMFGWKDYFFSIAEVSALIFIVTGVIWGASVKPFGLLYELLFFLCIYIFAFEKGVISKSLKRVQILHQVGKYSYSIYMTHVFILLVFHYIFINALKLPSSAYSYLFIFNYLLIYFFSAWTYKHIEIRFYHRGKDKKTGNKKGFQTVPSETL